MSFRDYLHEKAEESRHNETLAYLMFLAGTVLFIGSMLTTLNAPSETQWFLIIPYCSDAGSATFLSFALLFGGVSLTLFGLGAGVYYSRDRGWYMQELCKANSAEEMLMVNKNPKKNRRSRKKAKK